MHSKRQKRTVEPVSCRRSWKLCSTAKTRALARMPPPFRQPSYALLLHLLITESATCDLLTPARLIITGEVGATRRVEKSLRFRCRCPLWVISGHCKEHPGCLLYPQKWTCSEPAQRVR